MPHGWAVLLHARVAAVNQGELPAEVTDNGHSRITSFLWLCGAKIMVETLKKETLRTPMSIEICSYDMNASVVSNKPTLASLYLVFPTARTLSPQPFLVHKQTSELL